MNPSLLDSVYRVVFSVGALGVGWWLGGSFGLVMAAPLVGWLMAPVLLNGVIFGYCATRWLALHPLQGCHYAYRGVSIEVLEGDDGFRWLLARDVRHTLRSLPKDATLRLMEPERTGFDESGKRLAVRADALLHWLTKAHTDESIRFKVWVERSVHNPSIAVRRETEKKAIRNPVI